ncbi:MAG: site-specific integrase [Flavobacteriaceae bacterium]|nr:site-specific integrase [Flavobacteriaceae bacterium]
MKVTLRQRNQGKKTWLYLDYYENGKRTNKSLKLFLYPDSKTKEERKHNKETLALAQNIETKENIRIQSEAFGIADLKKADTQVVDFLERLAEERIDSPNNYGNWKSMIKHFKEFQKSGLSFNQLTRDKVEDFKKYIVTRPLSQNTKYSYFAKFKAALKEAVNREIIIKNPGQIVKHLPHEESRKEYLTLDELQAVSKQDCKKPLIKSAFLFGCLTGLRFSDIIALTPNSLRKEGSVYMVPFKQQKTKGFQYHPIGEQAKQLLPEPISNDSPYFLGLGKKLESPDNEILREWIGQAEIKKYITFHCSRHTYATIQLSLGTDIYVLSKLLGHRHLKTTEVYAKVVDQKKIEAANKIKLK